MVTLIRAATTATRRWWQQYLKGLQR